MDLRDSRELKKLSQEKLAVLSGVTQPTISMIETGKATPHATTRRKLEKVLGRRINWLPTKDQRVLRPTGKGTPWEFAEKEFRRALASINLLNKDQQKDFIKTAKRYLKELQINLKETR